MYDQEHDDDDLKNNTFLINLTTENIETAKNNDENIILPSEYWDDEINTSTTIPIEDQPWFNEIEINIDGITMKDIEKLTDKQLKQTDLINGKITVSNLMTDSQNKDGITKDSTLIPKLTTVTNKRLTSSTVTVSDILNDSTSLGLSRTSTLILDPPVNYGVANITNNGQYLPSDFNSSGNYDPTHSARWDYIDQINVTVTKKLKYIYNNGVVRNRTAIVNPGYSFSWTIGDSLVIITENTGDYEVNFLYSSTIAYTQTVQKKTWIWKFTTNSNKITFNDENNNQIISFFDSQSDSLATGVGLSKLILDLSLLLN